VGGIVHWTNAGSCSWYEFAVAIRELARKRLIVDKDVGIAPIRAEDYPRAADRPAYSVLDSSILWDAYGEPSNWRAAVSRVLDRLGNADTGQHAPKPGE
jgi:dTDP-4-dehydrorhamnose reductase